MERLVADGIEVLAREDGQPALHRLLRCLQIGVNLATAAAQREVLRLPLALEHL